MNGAEEQTINGKYLYYGFISGSVSILENQLELNRINVFPVSDKDTGSNLASTIRSVIDNITPHKSYKTTLENIANAALIGARGNSGVIFAQFLYGLSNETENRDNITLKEFVESVKKSIPYIYEATLNPVEGTMLTVIREWSDYLSSKKDVLQDFRRLIVDSIAVLEKSLADTTSKLKELNQHGFVDAGAKGFVVFIKGVVEFILNGNIRKLSVDNSDAISLVHSDEVINEEIPYRYCTEALIRNLQTDTSSLKRLLSENGDSVVVAGSDRSCRIHVHTNHPADLFHKLRDSGTITFQKVDDMVRQQEMAGRRKWKIALLTDSTCDLSQEIIDYYQINVVPINLNFGERHYLDKVTIQPEQFYDLLETEAEFPKTSQINESAFTNIYSQLASHYDAVISIHLTGQFSGTYANSVKAAKRIEKEFNKPIYVVDSRNLSGALGLLVLKAAEDIESGRTPEAIVESLESDISRAKIFVSVKDLKYMIKGGRVSKPAGIIAGLLRINPVISMKEDGKSYLFGNSFSQKGSLQKTYRHIEKISRNNTIWNYIILHAHNPSGAEAAVIRMKEITGKEPVSVVDISPVIGMHAGNGSIAISLLLNN
jgi:DegV family protein with EDD domain